MPRPCSGSVRVCVLAALASLALAVLSVPQQVGFGPPLPATAMDGDGPPPAVYPTYTGSGIVAGVSESDGGGARRRLTSYAPFVWGGGPVMHGLVNVYFIWYGSAWAASSQKILTDMIAGMSGSPWMGIETTYWDAIGNCSGFLALNGQATDANYSQGTAIASVPGVVATAILSGALPVDTNGLYVVLGDVNTNPSGLCTSWCGWHTCE